MKRMVHLAGVVALSLILALRAPAQHRVFTPLAPDRVEAQVEVLGDLADWCRSRHIYAQEQAVHTFLLELEPDRKASRRRLGYFRVSGQWKRADSWRPRRDHRAEHLPEARVRIREALKPLRVPFLQDLAQHPEGLARESAQRTIRALLGLEPEDPVLRAIVGETRYEGEWVLVETARSVRRNAELSTAIAKAREHAPAAVTQSVPADLEGWPLAWTTSVRTLGLEVVGTVPAEECASVAVELQTLARTFEFAFGVKGKHRDELRVLLLEGYGQRDLALEALALPPAVRMHLGSAAGGWLGSGRLLAEWDGDPERRRDGAVRQILGTMLMDEFGIDGGFAWAWEGFGLYLIHLQLGTRRTWFYQGSGYQPVADAISWTTAQDPASDWHALSRQLLTAENGPSVLYLLGRPLNSMRAQDLVLSYTLAAYLLEGWPDHTARLLRAIGSGEHPARAFERELGFPAVNLNGRMVRWLEESSNLARGRRADGEARKEAVDAPAGQ